jgi:hypothetical protein
VDSRRRRTTSVVRSASNIPVIPTSHSTESSASSARARIKSQRHRPSSRETSWVVTAPPARPGALSMTRVAAAGTCAQSVTTRLTTCGRQWTPVCAAQDQRRSQLEWHGSARPALAAESRAAMPSVPNACGHRESQITGAKQVGAAHCCQARRPLTTNVITAKLAKPDHGPRGPWPGTAAPGLGRARTALCPAKRPTLSTPPGPCGQLVRCHRPGPPTVASTSEK